MLPKEMSDKGAPKEADAQARFIPRCNLQPAPAPLGQPNRSPLHHQHRKASPTNHTNPQHSNGATQNYAEPQQVRTPPWYFLVHALFHF